MVGIVIVSHSHALGKALVGLVRQMSGPDVPIAVAAGIGPERAEFGTDAMQIVEAIQSVYSPDGVVVLMDLGSAILSAEMALDFLPEEMKPNIRFCPAPVVEGAITASVQAGLGSSLDVVCEEAAQALLPKIDQLGHSDEVTTPLRTAPVGTGAPGQAIVLQLQNIHGLHARPAARFVQTAARFDAEVQVRNLTSGKGPVSARSLNALATLGATQNDRIKIEARGRQAGEVLAALQQLADDKFGEGDEQVVQTGPVLVPRLGVEPARKGAVQAVPVSGGITFAPLLFFRPPTADVPQGPVDDPQAGWDNLLRAIERTGQDIQTRRDRISTSIGEAEGSIFDAHLLILNDPQLLEQVRALIFVENRNPAEAWQRAIQQTAESYRSLEDPYLRQRAADVLDVGNQVLFSLLGEAVQLKTEISVPSILFANDLTPTQTAQIDLEKILGMITVTSGPTSHTSILARAIGIPAVTGVDAALFGSLQEGTYVAMDGSAGLIWIEPAPEILGELREKQAKWQEQVSFQRESGKEAAVTLDRQQILIFANVGSVQEAQNAVKNGAEGIGLLRTEFLFLTRKDMPDENDQMDALTSIAEIMGDRPVIVRTLDVGGDKPLPYIKMPEEENPFLGVRAIRLSLREPELFRPQLRATMRAGARYNLKIMFPMISGVEEVLQVRRILAQVHQELAANDIPHRWPVETGIMVEIPSAALLARSLIEYVDFFSIGTNDLTQYTLAAERGNPALTGLADGLHPAVLRLINEVTGAAVQHRKMVSVCGELAGDPQAIPVLIGLGVNELSMNPRSIPAAKTLIRKLNFAEARDLASTLLKMDSPLAVRNRVSSFLEMIDNR